MRLRAKILTTACGVALVAGALAGSGGVRPALAGRPSTSDEAPPAMVSGLAHDLRISTEAARKLLRDQAEAHRVAKKLPGSLENQLAGRWFDGATGKLTVAVTNQAAAAVARAAGAGEVNPGDPWWPGGESNCSVGFGATDASGGKHFVTAGHCTNDANQPAYGQSGQRSRIGTSNVGGNRSVNAREGDLGVVAVTEAGWTISPSVNTWGNPAITVSGSKEAMVGEAVCHSGNTSPQWECGKVVKVNQAIDYRPDRAELGQPATPGEQDLHLVLHTEADRLSPSRPCRSR